MRAGARSLLLLLTAAAFACAGAPEGATGAPAGSAVPWSPGDSDLVFMSNHAGNAEIYLLPAGSGTWVNLTNHPGGDNWPVWSPDGRRIAFQSNRHGNLDLFVMEADGSNLVQLTDDPAHDYLPTWTSDGDGLYFASWRAEPGDGEPAVHVYAMKADGTEQRRLFADSPGTSTAPVPLPGGSGLVMPMKRDGQRPDLFLLDGSGAVLRQLTDDEAANGAPAVSPDGEWIAFYSELDATSSLVVQRIDGSGRHVVLAAGRNYYPVFSPDGAWLTYTAAPVPGEDEDLDVLAIRIDGSSGPHTLAGGPGRQQEGGWRPAR